MGVKGVTPKVEPGNEAPAVNEDEVPVVVKLTVPPALYAEYKELADRQGLTPAELMLHRLQRCKSHSSIRSLYFPESMVRQIEGLLQKRPVETPEQAIALLGAALSVSVGDFPPVPLSAQQAKRIHMSAYGGQTPYDRICAIVQTAVSKAVGI